MKRYHYGQIFIIPIGNEVDGYDVLRKHGFSVNTRGQLMMYYWTCKKNGIDYEVEGWEFNDKKETVGVRIKCIRKSYAQRIREYYK